MGTSFEVRGMGCIWLYYTRTTTQALELFCSYRLTVNSQPGCLPNFSSTRRALKSCFGSRRKRELALNRGNLGAGMTLLSLTQSSRVETERIPSPPTHDHPTL